jgi:hypothetical protein
MQIAIQLASVHHQIYSTSSSPELEEAMESMGGSSSGVGRRQQGGCEEASRNGGALIVAASRDYWRGNWTLPETMVLIEAKRKVHEEGEQGLARWRWVEDYCWRAGCQRSQNQCNDRWDNLMRDYKKVHAHELARRGGGEPMPSYWAMGSRAERKERGLPSNLLREIYDAMTEVVERNKVSSTTFLGSSPSITLLLDDAPVQAAPLAQVLPPPMPHQPLGTVLLIPSPTSRARSQMFLLMDVCIVGFFF